MSKAHLKRGAFSTVVKAPTFLFLLAAIFDFFEKKLSNNQK